MVHKIQVIRYRTHRNKELNEKKVAVVLKDPLSSLIEHSREKETGFLNNQFFNQSINHTGWIVSHLHTDDNIDRPVFLFGAFRPAAKQTESENFQYNLGKMSDGGICVNGL